jgi:hypothetical protein
MPPRAKLKSDRDSRIDVTGFGMWAKQKTSDDDFPGYKRPRDAPMRASPNGAKAIVAWSKASEPEKK